MHNIIIFIIHIFPTIPKYNRHIDIVLIVHMYIYCIILYIWRILRLFLFHYLQLLNIEGKDKKEKFQKLLLLKYYLFTCYI